VVPVGGVVITGVGCGSLLLHAASNIRPPRHAITRNVFLALILFDPLFLRHWLAGHTILTLNPTAKVQKLTAFRTEGTDRIVFPLDWLTAGWTLHES